MTVPVAADLAAWILVSRCEVGRTMWRTRPPCAKAPRWAIRRHDCDARPPWLSPATMCGAHMVELSDLPYPWVTCSACRTRFPTFHHLVPEIGPL